MGSDKPTVHDQYYDNETIGYKDQDPAPIPPVLKAIRVDAYTGEVTVPDSSKPRRNS